MNTATKSKSANQTELDVAVLQTKMDAVQFQLDDLRSDIRDFRESLERSTLDTRNMISDMKQDSQQAHDRLADKINVLEKYRYMLVGAGVILGMVGLDSLSNLLKHFG